MKTISAGLGAHLDKEVTTIASCWKIVRRDGQVFRFTDHDRDLTVAGEIYLAESSYTRTAVSSNSDFSVDNLDVAGVLDSDVLSPEEMRSGLFNRADVYVFIVNWQDTTQGILKVRRGWFGEITLQSNGTFQTEIRGLAQALSHNFIELYSSECRNDFCDTRCRLNIADYEATTTLATVIDRSSFTLDPGYTPPTQGLGYGTVQFMDGDNAGRVVEIVGYNATTKQVDLFEPVAYEILVGASVKVAPGCDKSLARCNAYGNVVNRQAEDYVPGQDELMSYPDAK
jgi:uncharacterized phage protein (TIGR02218 family)